MRLIHTIEDCSRRPHHRWAAARITRYECLHQPSICRQAQHHCISPPVLAQSFLLTWRPQSCRRWRGSLRRCWWGLKWRGDIRWDHGISRGRILQDGRQRGSRHLWLGSPAWEHPGEGFGRPWVVQVTGHGTLFRCTVGSGDQMYWCCWPYLVVNAAAESDPYIWLCPVDDQWHEKRDGDELGWSKQKGSCFLGLISDNSFDVLWK
jgi:hypothetical protein